MHTLLSEEEQPYRVVPGGGGGAKTCQRGDMVVYSLVVCLIADVSIY